MKRKRRRSGSQSSDEELDQEIQYQPIWSCGICLKQYKNKKTLKQHTQSHMSRRKCDLCDKSYAYLKDLHIHRYKMHGIKNEAKQNETKQKTNSFQCDLCNKTFKRNYHLIRHTSTVHGCNDVRQSRLQFSCRHCDAVFQDYDQLFRHVMDHHPLNQQGGRRATTPSSLNITEHNQNASHREDTAWTGDQRTQEHQKHRIQEKQEKQKNEQQDVETMTDSRQTTNESALHNAVLNRNIHPKGSERYDALTFFGNVREQVRSFLQSRVRSLGVKFSLCLQVEMQRDDGGSSSTASPFFRSRTYIALSLDDLNDHTLNEAMQKMYASLEKYMREGSGWYVRKVLKLEVQTVVYKPIRASEYLPLPKSLALSHSILNIQNSDDRCFLYCLLASLHPTENEPECVEHYYQYVNEIDMSGISYPVTLSQIRNVEKQNENVSVNVFAYEDESIVPLRITKHNHRLHHINLLWLSNGENSHYCLIRNLNRFLSRSKSYHTALHYCPYCLHGYTKEKLLIEHQPYCSTHGAQRVDLPIPGENDILEFKEYEKTMKAPFVIYADFETIIRRLHTCAPDPSISTTTPTTNLEVCGFGYKVVCEDSRYTKPPVIYRGPDADVKFIENVLQEQEEIQDILSSIAPMEITDEYTDFMENATQCCLCNKQFTQYDKSYSRIVRHHNHLTGKIVGPACNKCNLNCKQVDFIPVIFHNLRGFDSHILCDKLGRWKDHKINCIAQNAEKYVSFSMDKLRFIDSLQFLPTSLESLVNNLGQDGLHMFTHLLSAFDRKEEAQLLLRKGVYPYEYMDSFDRFDEKELPTKECFYSAIKKEHISDEDYEHAQTVFQTFNMTSLGQYHDLYLKTDVLLLSDVFESFRSMCLKQYELDPCHFYTSPGLSWASCLKMTGVQLELLTDIDMVLMVEEGIRGGVSQISNRHKKANNSYLPDYDPSKPMTYLQYLDANNLYGWAMMQPLPVGGFSFMEKEDINTLDIMTVPKKSDTGYILEVSLEYPRSLHDNHNCLPLAPVKKAISNEELSPYVQHLLRKLLGLSDDDPLPNRGQVTKLLTTLEDKEKYVLHYINLQLYLQLGMKLKTIHRALKFTQQAWMADYISRNTSLRQASATPFQKNFFKLMNVSVFGKTMENVRRHKNIELVHTERRLEKVAAKPTYRNTTILNDDLVAVELYRAKVNLFKPIYCGMCILDLSKCLMYDFWYNFIKKQYGNTAQLQMTDTDSVLFSCETDDIYEDMKVFMDYFDTSEYPKDHPLQSDKNKKVVGKMKDETKGKPISEFVGLRSKKYSFLCDNEEEKRAKGIAKATIKKELKHAYYKETLFGETKMISSMCCLRSHKHKIFGETIQKTGLSAFDDKRYLIDAVSSYAYGHYKIASDSNCNSISAESDNAVVESDNALSKSDNSLLKNDNRLMESNYLVTDTAPSSFSVIPVENFSMEYQVNWGLEDEQAFTLGDFKITPCTKF